MDFWYKVCCCCCHREEELEKNPLLVGDTLQYFNKLAKRRRSEAVNLWNEPVDSTHMERDDDHELYMLLQKRSKMKRGSEGYRRLSFDISAHRQIRRKVKDRWKQILEVLGFENEADGLLTVTSSTAYESLRNPQEARRLHSALAEQTAIFGRHRGGPPERYLFVLDRLILLDVGEDFLSATRHFYPVQEEEEEEKEEDRSSSDEKPSSPGPVLVKLSNGAQEEAEEEEEEEEVFEE
ncbi:melanoregulin-like isoform X1 [Hemicordylus capensis]|uniref:melanoregulin-like isoform X1 n=1 Tax=Hemicordylus capensis TaxID=884348 RepID=UPI002304BBE9|nr:melanoregulin-like isoform X1 [Hemicordylus capensis]